MVVVVFVVVVVVVVVFVVVGVEIRCFCWLQLSTRKECGRGVCLGVAKGASRWRGAQNAQVVRNAVVPRRPTASSPNSVQACLIGR